MSLAAADEDDSLDMADWRVLSLHAIDAFAIISLLEIRYVGSDGAGDVGAGGTVIVLTVTPRLILSFFVVVAVVVVAEVVVSVRCRSSVAFTADGFKFRSSNSPLLRHRFVPVIVICS